MTLRNDKGDITYNYICYNLFYLHMILHITTLIIMTRLKTLNKVAIPYNDISYN
jgi:hypothetical protein